MDQEEKFKEPEILRFEDGTQAKSPVGLIEPGYSAPKELHPGDIVVGRYQVVSLLGRGAMGSVYRAEQLSIRKHVALKTLNPIAGSDVNVRRFQNEALAASKLEHANLVRALDYGWLGNQPFLVMDLVEGPTLSQHLKKRTATLSLQTAYETFIPICFALAYAHQEGVIHRDLKPSNILLAPDPHNKDKFIPKLADFGIAKLVTEEDLTRTGEVFGTPLYMSPEQCLGSKVDNRSDIYSLGCVLYEALTGAPPFHAPSALETMMQHRATNPLPLKEAALGLDFPDALQRIVSKMLEKEPDRRYQNCLDVAQDLTLLQQGREDLVVKGTPAREARKSNRPNAGVAIVSAVLFVVAGVAGGVAFFSQPHTSTILAKEQAHSPETSVGTSGIETERPVASNLSSTGTTSGGDSGSLPDAFPSPFSRIDQQKKLRIFDFGDSRMGTIGVMQSLLDDQIWAARRTLGTVSFPADKPLLLDMNIDEAYKNPFQFRRFRPDDLHGLRIHTSDSQIFSDLETQLDTSLSYAAHLTALNYLNLEGTHITFAAFKNMHFDRLAALEALIVGETQVDCKELAQYPKVLLRLKNLVISHLKNGSRVLRVMQKSKEINFLGVGNTDLSDSDVDYIASMSNLKTLDVSGNKIINDASLAKLSQLRALVAISLEQTSVSPACGRELAKFPKLSRIIFSSKFKSYESRLRGDLPGYALVFRN